MNGQKSLYNLHLWAHNVSSSLWFTSFWYLDRFRSFPSSIRSVQGTVNSIRNTCFVEFYINTISGLSEVVNKWCGNLSCLPKSTHISQSAAACQPLQRQCSSGCGFACYWWWLLKWPLQLISKPGCVASGNSPPPGLLDSYWGCARVSLFRGNRHTGESFLPQMWGFVVLGKIS